MTTPRLALSSPADILAAVPYLLGFHPDDSLVVTGFTGSALRLSSRCDLPVASADLRRLIPVLRRSGVTLVMLVGYGPGPLVTPAVDEATRLLREAGFDVAEALRAEGGRYWSYSCSNAACCPAEGTPFDPAVSQVAAIAVTHGLVALPDRRSLARSVEPSGGAAMRLATRAVAGGLRARLARARQAGPDGPDGPGGHDPLAADLVAEGLARVREAVIRYDSGGRLADEEAARLGFDLALIRIRDEAWTLLDDRDVHVALWRDMTRRLEPRYAAPAASLLAAASWQQGDCALAGLAVERALAADPGYTMALLLRQALTHMVPPETLRDRMPTTCELDDEMGPPRAAWLAPLRAWLIEDPVARTG
ncbi:DUF4192 domain-containing protein [Microbispora sp. RL4-1S]|uniref:DUF4192 domain-containing protein n=1 Tax=Microbispora oryzae TaxID=2806554 RepID=A0A940WTC7_9ACTN|nr:DUF4192 domain-containing protein [Microbispora oryzae]MBP2706659.1 DUF4192 domain-containing protein [Microbispora oryzae]